MPASAISATGAETFALLTAATSAAAQRVTDLNLRTAPALYKAQLGTYLKELASAVAALDAAYTSQLGTPPNWGAGVADINALKAVAAAARVDKQTRVVESNGKGGESIYIFDAESTLDAEDINVIVPTDVTPPAAGRWILASQGGVRTLPVTAGEGISKADSCYISGWDNTNKRLIVMKADSTDPAKAAVGMAPAAILNGAAGYLAVGEVTITGVNTSAASAAGVPVYFSNVGAPAYTAPASNAQQVGVVAVKNASGSIRVAIRPPPAPSAASITVPGLQSAADKSKQDNTRSYLTAQVPPSMLGAGADVSVALGRAGAPSTVTGVHWLIEAAPTVEPAAAPDDLVVSLKNGTVTVATKTYVGALTPGAFDALTLSGVAGELDLVDGDKLTLELTQNGVCQLAKQVLFQATMVPKA